MCLSNVSIAEKESITTMYKVFSYSPSSKRYYALYYHAIELSRRSIAVRLSDYLNYKPCGGYSVFINMVDTTLIGYHGFKHFSDANKYIRDKWLLKYPRIVEFIIPPTATVYEGQFGIYGVGLAVNSKLSSYKVVVK